MYLLLTFSLLGCEKDRPLAYSSTLMGKWSWLFSCGGFAGCSTPTTTNITRSLVLTEDSLSYYYENEVLQLSGPFSTRKIIDQNQDTINLISLYTSQEELSYTIKHDTLRLTTLNYLFDSGWKRIK